MMGQWSTTAALAFERVDTLVCTDDDVVCAGCGVSVMIEGDDGPDLAWHDAACPVESDAARTWALYVCPTVHDGFHGADTARWYPDWWVAPECPRCEAPMHAVTSCVAYHAARDALALWQERGCAERERRDVVLWQRIAAELAELEREGPLATTFDSEPAVVTRPRRMWR